MKRTFSETRIIYYKIMFISTSYFEKCGGGIDIDTRATIDFFFFVNELLGKKEETQ